MYLGDGLHYCSAEIRKRKKLFNFILSMRKGGKTFDLKVNAVMNHREKKTARNFVYVRRQSVDIESNKMLEFFNKMQQEGYYTGDEFDFRNGRFYRNKELMGYAVSLSSSKASRSVDFTDVGEIYFEEFVLLEDDNHRYLKNEVTDFLELYSTIDRYDYDIPVYFLGNTIQLYNPYFIYFDVIPPKGYGIKTFGDIAVEIWDGSKLVEKLNQRRFNKMIRNTDYYDYSVESQSFETLDKRIKKPPRGAQPICDFFIHGNQVGLWRKGSAYYMAHPTHALYKCGVTDKDIVDNGAVSTKMFKQSPMWRLYKDACLSNLIYLRDEKIEQLFRMLNKKLYI